MLRHADVILFGVLLTDSFFFLVRLAPTTVMSYSNAQYNTSWYPNPPVLYRVIREYDLEPATGFTCGDLAADLTFDDHIQKGFNNTVLSQYISTTKSLRTAIIWIMNKDINFGTSDAFAIISLKALSKDIECHDLSGYCLSLLNGDSWANDMSTKHKEVLLTPYVNKEAIIRIVSKTDLEHCISWSAKESYVNDWLSTCGYCGQWGHNVRLGDLCQSKQYDEIEELANIQCDYCGEQGHDDDQCEQLEIVNALEAAANILCDFCGEQGHDVDQCEQLEFGKFDAALNIRCDYCGEWGHDLCRGDYCQEHQFDSLVDNYETLAVS